MNPVGGTSGRWAWAEIDLEAVAHNVGVLRQVASPAAVWAVVKADAYGHGALPVARAALDAGATGLCVALVQEGVELRRGGITSPILVLSQQPPAELDDLVEHGLTATVYTHEGIEALRSAADRRARPGCGVHLKIDTGMHRVGAAPADAAGLFAEVRSTPELRLIGIFTHLAVADVPEHPANAVQLALFDEVLSAIGALGHTRGTPDGAGTPSTGIELVVHAANSAGAIALPAARHSLVRAGIALYGISPGPGLAADHADLLARLRPAMSLKARIGHVRWIDRGEGVSYGLRFVASGPTRVATVPIGYADGVPRALSACGGEVLIGGARCRMLGTVTMDQLMIEIGPQAQVGDEVVLLGRQGADEIRAEEWAERVGTIGYEITCGISRRIARRHHRGGGRQ